MEESRMKQHKQRKHYTAEEKVAILRLNLIKRVPVSDICEEYHLQPSVYYRWQQEFFEHGALAFERKNSYSERVEKQRIAQLETKLQKKNEVISELMEEHTRLKKTLGVR